jgi:hypothetical protein
MGCGLDFGCHVKHVMLGVGGIVDVERGCGSGLECIMSGSYCISLTACVLVWVCVCVCVGGWLYCGINCVWQVLIARRCHLPSCSSCNPEEPVRSLVHCV